MIGKKYPNLKGSIFIVTYGRSGSTLLQSLVQSIPGTHIAGENFNTMLGLFRAAHSARKTSDTWGRRPHPKNHPWHGADKINPDRFEKRLVDVFIKEILKPPKDVRWLGFKEIRFASLEKNFEEFLNFHRRNFPNAFFIFNSRNGDDVAKSKWWAKRPSEDVLKMVKTMDRRFARYTRNNPDCSHHVFYEELVNNPESLQVLFDKMGEPLDLSSAQETLSNRLTH